MKKKLLLVTALAVILAAGTVSAADQTGHEMMHGTDAGSTAATQQAMPPMGSGMMGGDGQGMMMGPGMMGRGGMMGQGGMMGPGMMGMMGGQGGMMGGGMGMGACGMMGGSGYGHGMMGWMMGNMTQEEQQKFLDATKEMRRKLHDKQFEYGEAARNPKTTKAELLKKRKEMWELRQKIHGKAWEFMKE